MDPTHAQLIRDLAEAAQYRWFGRPTWGAGHRARIAAGCAARAIGNHALAQLEDSLDAAAEADAAGRFALLVSASIAEARARRTELTAAVSG
jgi:hypothetical protein